jgi:hypothetical protein
MTTTTERERLIRLGRESMWSLYKRYPRDADIDVVLGIARLGILHLSNQRGCETRALRPADPLDLLALGSDQSRATLEAERRI